MQPSRGMDVQNIDVFSETYLMKNKQLSLNTDTEEFDFISHAWLITYIDKLYEKLFLMSEIQSLREEILDNQLTIQEPTISDVRSLRTTKELCKYTKFLQLSKIHEIRKNYPLILAHTLTQIDRMLASFILQERHLESNPVSQLQKLYANHYQNNFYDIKRILLLLRSDMEIVSWINQLSATQSSPLKEAEELIKPCMGRIFFVVKKELEREITGVTSGTVVEIHGKRLIMTCRHFNPIARDQELEIYFIPSYELNTVDFLPLQRVEHKPSIVDWNQYRRYSVIRISLLNTPDMESKLLVGGKEPLIITKSRGIHLLPEDIRVLKKLDDTPENDDLAFMEIKEPAALKHACLMGSEAIDLNSPQVWAAGYPGAGLADYSFAVVGNSQSELYKTVIHYQDDRLRNPHWHYKISSFPLSHGMSGGPVFFIKGKIPHVVAILKGLDYKSAGVLCSIVTVHHLDNLK